MFTRDDDTDVDNHLRYEFTKEFPYATEFGIDRLRGMIYTLVPLDREVKDVYTFNVRVFDESKLNTSGFEDVAQVSVIVRDENDNRPNITFPNAVNNTFR